MLPVRPTSQFRKDLKKTVKQDRDLDKVKKIIQKLAVPEPLPHVFRDHKLRRVAGFP